jgi:hypothetical protein
MLKLFFHPQKIARPAGIDAALLKPGENEMTFNVPGGHTLQSVVVWHNVHFELDENHASDGASRVTAFL